MPRLDEKAFSPEYLKVRAVVRKNMADLYRKVRKDSPAIARLMYKRQRDSVQNLIAALMHGWWF